MSSDVSSEPLPEFGRPPVVETILGVQFAPLPGFTSGHLGRYWRDCLDGSWTRTLEAAHLPDQFERFGRPDAWNLPAFELHLQPGPRPGRLQILHEDDDRVIQLQDTRFISNWRRKRGAEYPRFRALLPEFLGRYADFGRFAEAAGLGSPSANQWEFSYINHLPQGDLWRTPDDWRGLLPGLYPAASAPDGLRFESMAAEFHFEIAPGRGRLHASCQHGRAGEGEGDEVIVLQLTARGAIGKEDPPEAIAAALELGHRALVRTFVRLASPRALELWEMR